jgi:hypothetical protein
MSFETKTLLMIAPLDPNEGEMYNEPTDEDAWNSIIMNIYKITGCREYYANPTVDGELSWRSMESYDTDSKDAMKRWQNKLYEFSTRICACITTEVCEEEFGSYRFDGSDPVDVFISWIPNIFKNH